jgi:hypothetical protein
MSKPSGIYRQTVSITLDLKRRMDKVADQVNWSAAAAQAFEQKLAELSAKKEKKTMQDVIQRLRGSKQQTFDKTYRKGEQLGRQWAMDRAGAAALRELEMWVERKAGTDWESFLGESEKKGWDLALGFYMNTHPEENGPGGGSASDLFWRQLVDEDDLYLSQQPDFLRGFANGSLAIWREVKDQL